MMKVRYANERGHANHGWLDTWHSFSFAHYYDPEHMGISALRVINDDTVAPGAGFGTHGHSDMEIVSYVLSGSLEHKDSMGFGTVIKPGEVQRMSAGTGVSHSEFNASSTEPVNFLQIWIIPDSKGIEPGYEQKAFHDDLQGKLRLVVSKDGREGSLSIHQDVDLYASRLKVAETIDFTPDKGRTVYIHIARGAVKINGVELSHGDGVTLQQEPQISIAADSDSEFLLFNLP